MKRSRATSFKIRLEDDGDTEILIRNEATLQRYSFSDRILFRRNKYDLNEEGKRTLRIVGREIKKNLKDIKEIQIQGHADPDRPAEDYFFNLDLAASRAIEVYKFLQRSIRIDPARHLMSATSFGEYKPVQRSTDDSTYNSGQKLMQDNKALDALKAKNRRIEILLFYQLEQTDPYRRIASVCTFGCLPPYFLGSLLITAKQLLHKTLSTSVRIVEGIVQQRPPNTRQTLGKRYVWNFKGKSYTILMTIDIEKYNSYDGKERYNIPQLVEEGRTTIGNLTREFQNIFQTAPRVVKTGPNRLCSKLCSIFTLYPRRCDHRLRRISDAMPLKL